MRKITKKSHFWSKKPPKMRPKIKKKRKKNVLEKNAKIRGGGLATIRIYSWAQPIKGETWQQSL